MSIHRIDRPFWSLPFAVALALVWLAGGSAGGSAGATESAAKESHPPGKIVIERRLSGGGQSTLRLTCPSSAKKCELRHDSPGEPGVIESVAWSQAKPIFETFSKPGVLHGSRPSEEPHAVHWSLSYDTRALKGSWDSETPGEQERQLILLEAELSAIGAR